MSLIVTEDSKLIDIETPGLVSQDAIVLHGVEYGGIDYGSATAFWRFGFRHVVKVRDGIIKPKCDRSPLKGDEPYLGEWVSNLQAPCALYVPPQYHLWELVYPSFVMAVKQDDATRLVELDPHRFELTSWGEVRHWDLENIGVDMEDELAKRKVSQWEAILAACSGHK